MRFYYLGRHSYVLAVVGVVVDIHPENMSVMEGVGPYERGVEDGNRMIGISYDNHYWYCLEGNH